VEIMDKHGPMEINDERLFGQLAILPENSQMLIQNFGGLEKFLLSSTAFVKHEGLICLAEYAAVVAASMNSGIKDDDILTSSLSSNNLKHTDSDVVVVNKIQEGPPYGLKQKGFSKINKGGMLGAVKSSGINGVAHNKALYSGNSSSNSRNEVGIKKNSAMMQQQTPRQGIYTTTPPPGFVSNSPIGKPLYSNKSTHPYSNNSNTTNGGHSMEAASKHMSTKYNTKDSLSSGLDPIDNSLIFSRKNSGLLNSTSTEHSQEVPSYDDEGLIGNLFSDYNTGGTGSSSNYLSPSNDHEGYFPNAYPQEQIDSASLLSDISIPPAMDSNVTNKVEHTTSKESSTTMFELSAATAPSVMNSTDNMKPLTSSNDLKTMSNYVVNPTAVNNSSVASYNSGGHHMEPVYLPPPPPIQPPTMIVDKKNACVETDAVYVYSENYKEKYETAMRSRSEVLRRLEESEDRRVQMNKTHAMELDLAVRKAKEDTKMVRVMYVL